MAVVSLRSPHSLPRSPAWPLLSWVMRLYSLSPASRMHVVKLHSGDFQLLSAPLKLITCSLPIPTKKIKPRMLVDGPLCQLKAKLTESNTVHYAQLCTNARKAPLRPNQIRKAFLFPLEENAFTWHKKKHISRISRTRQNTQNYHGGVHFQLLPGTSRSIALNGKSKPDKIYWKI